MISSNMIQRKCSKLLKFFGMYFTFILILITLCAYILYLDQYYSNHKLLESRCYSELSSVKYQLNGEQEWFQKLPAFYGISTKQTVEPRHSEITQYKNHLDNVLMETQKAEATSRVKYKELLQSCTALKEQSFLCQSQFEELQSECVKVRQKLDEVTIETATLKNLS